MRKGEINGDVIERHVYVGSSNSSIDVQQDLRPVKKNVSRGGTCVIHEW